MTSKLVLEPREVVKTTFENGARCQPKQKFTRVSKFYTRVYAEVNLIISV